MTRRKVLLWAAISMVVVFVLVWLWAVAFPFLDQRFINRPQVG